MAFFEPPPPPEPDDHDEDFRQPEWLGPPTNVLGTPVPLRLMLARSDDVAIAVMGVLAYSTGVSLTLVVRWRRPSYELDRDPLGLFGRLSTRRAEAELPDDLLRFGVQLSDGTKATSTDQGGWPPNPEAEPSGPLLMQSGGGGGGGGDWSYGFWLWPLPPPGPLAFVCEWPAQRIELTRQEIDAGVLRKAAEHAERLWEDEGGGSGGATTSWLGL